MLPVTKPPRRILVGSKAVLVPYLPLHVPMYHSWMSLPSLLLSTASEPLSLAEEYEMCTAWRTDKTKYTFILLDAEVVTNSCPSLADFVVSPGVNSSDVGLMSEHAGSAVGDVNLFLSVDSDSDSDTDASAASAASLVAASESRPRRRPPRLQGELEIMVARPSARRRGLALEALNLMMDFAVRRLAVRRFFVKIGDDNVPSRTLFEGKLGFGVVRYETCFRETELERIVKEEDEIGKGQEDGNVVHVDIPFIEPEDEDGLQVVT